MLILLLSYLRGEKEYQQLFNFLVISVTFTTQTTRLTGITNVLSLGDMDLFVQAAKVSDGAYRIKLGTYIAAIHCFVMSSRKVTSSAIQVRK